MSDQVKPITAIVAQNVQQMRKARGWSARALAERTSGRYSRSMIANLENGQVADIGVDQLYALAEALEVEPWSLADPNALCAVCSNTPPTGFTCNNCGRG